MTALMKEPVVRLGHPVVLYVSVVPAALLLIVLLSRRAQHRNKK